MEFLSWLVVIKECPRAIIASTSFPHVHFVRRSAPLVLLGGAFHVDRAGQAPIAGARANARLSNIAGAEMVVAIGVYVHGR
jgi:hypothetical protein